MGSPSNSTNRLVNITHFNISQDPIHIPGDEKVFVEVDVLRTLGNHFKMDVVAQKLLGSTFINIPCLGSNTTGFGGSCSYDICQELLYRCSQCVCPVQLGTYTLQSKAYHIEKLSSLFALLASGDYRFHAVITDTTSGEEVNCFEFTVTTTTDCTGPLCFIG